MGFLDQACKEAAFESKVVFLKSGYGKCHWCKVFDRYHQKAAVSNILNRYFVLATIDTKNMPDGSTVYGRYSSPGAPAWVILSPEKSVIIDSYREGKNVGYPAENIEIAHYLDALKLASPSITSEELGVLSVQLKELVKKEV